MGMLWLLLVAMLWLFAGVLSMGSVAVCNNNFGYTRLGRGLK